MKKISAANKEEVLNNNPKWKALVEIRNSLMKLIPMSEHSENQKTNQGIIKLVEQKQFFTTVISQYFFN